MTKCSYRVLEPLEIFGKGYNKDYLSKFESFFYDSVLCYAHTMIKKRQEDYDQKGRETKATWSPME